MPSYATMKEGQNAAKVYNGGHYKWASKPGNGIRNANFQCNDHKGCGHHIRVVAVNSSFEIQQKGEHSTEVNNKARKNSTLTFAEDNKLREAVDQGARPGGVLVSMTKTKMLELRSEGKDPVQFKRPEGGLEGTKKRHMSSQYNSAHVLLVYCPCISCVSFVYCSCIIVCPIDTCIADVSLMYR